MQESSFAIAVKWPNQCVKPKEDYASPVMNHTEVNWDLSAETPTCQKLTVKCVRK